MNHKLDGIKDEIIRDIFYEIYDEFENLYNLKTFSSIIYDILTEFEQEIVDNKEN